MLPRLRYLVGSVVLTASSALSESDNYVVPDSVISEQRERLAVATDGMGFGPQSPRDIDAIAGNNSRTFSTSIAVTEMALCDIHFHENAEHKGGSFTAYAGNGNGHGYGTGFKYDGELTDAELASLDIKVGESEHGDLVPGDTIEIHFVYSTAAASLGPTLGTCLTESIANPQLRVETVVAVLVAESGKSLVEMARIEKVNGYNQVPNLPTDLGNPIIYAGSTTGPSYNEKGSPFQVVWSVRPAVVKLDIMSVDAWLQDNPFDEKHAHGVRNLVTNLDLLSRID